MSESPAKKLNFEAAGKENAPASELTVDAKVTKPVVEKAQDVAKEAPSIKELEASEPLLQENPNRFVLFPIKYHEVRCCASSTRRV